MHAYAQEPEPQATTESGIRWVRPALGALHKLTADDVERMLAAGILTEDDRVELLDGALIVVSPQGTPHIFRLTALNELFQDHFRPIGQAVVVQCPLDCGPTDRPEPDFAIVPRGSFDATRPPAGDKAVLVVEVAATSQARDRAKGALYAQAGVGEYWLLDLAANTLEVYRQPLPSGRWAQTALLEPKATVQPPGLDVTWSVADLLGLPAE